MSRSKSSRKWLKEHFSDPFVKQSKTMGYRSRAVYKLIEIQKRDKLIKPGHFVIDLGAAPGSWSQVIAEWVGEKGHVIALDILPMADLPAVHFIQGDFRDEAIFEEICQVMGEHKADVIVSDMAPNTSGIPGVDQPRAMELSHLSLDLAKKILKKNGHLLIKVFQGAGHEEFLKTLKNAFREVIVRKPEASRDRSRECYLLAKGFML